MSGPARGCALCRRAVPRLTRHHLIPRTRHRNRQVRQRFSREEMQGRILLLCPACHEQVHACISEKELALRYNTLESLLAHPELRRFVEWLAQRPAAYRPRVRRRR